MTGDAKNQVLRDFIISGFASDKISAKVVKERHKVTLNRAMEIARLEVSMQHHLDRMQETAKVNYMFSMENPPRPRRGRNHSLGQAVQGQVGIGAQANPVEKVKSLHFLWTPATDVGKANTKKHRTAKLWTQHAEDVERKDTMKRFASRGNTPHTL